MKVTVVGQWGGYPAVDGATSSYLFEKDNFTLLVDVGSAAVSKLQNMYLFQRLMRLLFLIIIMIMWLILVFYNTPG